MGDNPLLRMAVLIDAGSTDPGAADALFELLSGYGVVSVRRAFADWTKQDLRPWFAKLRRHGIQPVHHFAGHHPEQALVALTIDAVDIARESAVDAVAVVGDLGSSLPLVDRLRAAGLHVLVVGPARTPHTLRAACDEFIDASTLTDASVSNPGKHRS